VPTVLINSLALQSDADPLLEPLRHEGHEIRFSDPLRVRSEVALAAALDGVAATLASTEPYTARVLDQAPELRVISRLGVGYDAIDVAAATRHGVAVCTTPGANHIAVADMAVTLLLACLRRLLPSDRTVHGGGWAQSGLGRDVRATTIGVVGTGLIGREVVQRLAGFGPTMLMRDVVETPALVERYGARYVSLDELLAASDVITLHVPLLPETRGLIGEAALRRVKPTAYLVNTARGPLVDEAALVEALREKRIAGAALDVFAEEPLSATSALREFDNVILTPHVAGVTQESVQAMAQMAIENVRRVLRGEAPVHAVNADGIRPSA
jgi:D-3-phosphoglycerate dehydrogenase / 2-oxoglutarate reductase